MIVQPPRHQICPPINQLNRCVNNPLILKSFDFRINEEHMSCEHIAFSSHLISTVMGGTKRLLSYAVKWAAPLLPSQLLKMFDLMSDSPCHVCTCAAILTGFRALLHKCQLTDSESVLCRSDFSFDTCGICQEVEDYPVLGEGAPNTGCLCPQP